MKLENTEKLEGDVAQELNKLLKAYGKVKAQLDDLKLQQNELVEKIKTICDHKAIYETRSFVLKMNIRKGNDFFNKPLLKTKYPKIFEEVNKVNNEYLLVMGDVIKK